MSLNWLTHTVVCDPNDMMFVDKTQLSSRDFSIRRVDRLHRETKAVRERLLNSTRADNTFDKRYRSGMILSLSFPSVNELSGRPLRYLCGADYDRWPEDIDGEGSGWYLMRARKTVYGMNGMVAIELSPGYPWEKADWSPKTPHEAPPCKGILSIYNTGDRRRWYWQCVSCDMPFEPHRDRLVIPRSNDKKEAAEATVMGCPHCGQIYHHDGKDGVPGKNEMNQLQSGGGRATWLKDGERLTEGGVIVGKGVESTTGSFWLHGVAATFNTWTGLVRSFCQPKRPTRATATKSR